MVLERCFAIQSLCIQRAIIAIIDGTIENCPLYRFFGYMVENKRLTLVFFNKTTLYVWCKRWKKWECSQFRYLRELLFCDTGWANHFAGGPVVLRALLGVRRMTDMVMREQTTTMTSRAMAMPFQFLWGGLTPPRSWGRTRRRKEHRWGQEMWGLAALLDSPLDASPRSTSAAALWHYNATTGKCGTQRGGGGGGGEELIRKKKSVLILAAG